MAPPDRTESKTLDPQGVADLSVRRLQEELPGLDPSEIDALSGEVRIKVRRAAGRAAGEDLAALATRVATQTAAGYRRRRTIWESVLLPWIDEAVDGTLPSTISTGTLGHLVDRAWCVAHEVLAGARAGARAGTGTPASARFLRMRVGGKTWAAIAADAGLTPEDVADRWGRHGRGRLARAARQADGLFLYWKWFEEDAAGGRPQSEHTWTRRRLAAFAARLLDEAEEARFRRHLDACGSCSIALVAISEDPRPDDAREGHLPASVLARWEQAGDDLVGLERAMVRRHLERCDGCREDLRHVGFEPALPRSADLDREIDLSDPEGAEEEALVADAPIAGATVADAPIAAAPAAAIPRTASPSSQTPPARQPATASPASPEPAPAASGKRMGYVVMGPPTTPGVRRPSAAPPIEKDDRPQPEVVPPAKAGGKWKSALAFLTGGSGASASGGAGPSRPSGPAAPAGKRALRGNLRRLTEAWDLLREYMVGGPAALKPEAAEEFLALQGEIVRILPVFHEEFREASRREIAHLAARRARDLLVDVPTIRSMQSRLGANREELDRIWHEVFLMLAELAGRGR